MYVCVFFSSIDTLLLFFFACFTFSGNLNVQTEFQTNKQFHTNLHSILFNNTNLRFCVVGRFGIEYCVSVLYFQITIYSSKCVIPLLRFDFQQFIITELNNKSRTRTLTHATELVCSKDSTKYACYFVIVFLNFSRRHLTYMVIRCACHIKTNVNNVFAQTQNKKNNKVSIVQVWHSECVLWFL